MPIKLFFSCREEMYQFFLIFILPDQTIKHVVLNYNINEITVFKDNRIA